MSKLDFEFTLRVGGVALPTPTSYTLEEDYTYSSAERGKTGKFIGDPLGIGVIYIAEYDFFPLTAVAIINSEIKKEFKNGEPIVRLTYNDLTLKVVEHKFYYKGGPFRMTREAIRAGGYADVQLKFISEELL